MTQSLNPKPTLSTEVLNSAVSCWCCCCCSAAAAAAAWPLPQLVDGADCERRRRLLTSTATAALVSDPADPDTLAADRGDGLSSLTKLNQGNIVNWYFSRNCSLISGEKLRRSRSQTRWKTHIMGRRRYWFSRVTGFPLIMVPVNNLVLETVIYGSL